MKHFKFVGLIMLILSACSATPPPVVLFVPSPTTRPMTSTPVPSVTEQPLVTQTPSITDTPLPECKDSVSIVSWTRDDVPYDFNDYDNNKPVPPNGQFTMTWTLQNSGTCIWNNSYMMAFNSGRIMTQSASYPIVSFGQTIAPGQNAIITISMVAPEKTGGYQTVWQLQNDKGRSLMTFNVIVKVDRGSFDPPSHPVDPRYIYSCTAGVAKINLTWIDTAKNEDGYRIYRNSVPISEFSAGTSSYIDVVPGVGVYEYTVVAFNVAGEAPINISVVVADCK